MKNKKIKLNLNDLKVESFVTSLNNKNADTVKGGILVSPITFGVSLSVAIVAVTVIVGEFKEINDAIDEAQ